MENGTLHLEFLNPRSDRSLVIHGNDAGPVMEMDSQVSEFITTQLRLSKSTVYIDTELSLLGPYGCCKTNAQRAVQSTGSGWMGSVQEQVHD